MRAARQRDPADAPRRTLLLLGATIVLLIVGLLGMHALSGGSSHAAGVEHGGALTAVAAHDAHAAGPYDTTEQCGDGCAVPAPGHAPDAPGHEGIAACVLALLAGLILLVPPAATVRAGTLATARWSVLAAAAARRFLPPPSLTQLSISRI